MAFKFKSGGRISLWIPISVAAILGTVFSLILYIHLLNISKEDLYEKFQRAALERSNLIVANLNNYLRDLEAVQRFYDGSENVSREEFKKFVLPIIRDKGFQAIEWLPRIKAEKRSAFEQSVRDEGFQDFRFTELDSTGKLITAKERAEYFPVHYVEPYKGNETAFGYAPPSSNPARGMSLIIACDSNKPIVSERIVLIQEKEKHFAFLVVLPVYKGTKYTPEDVKLRREMLEGYIQGVLRPVDIIEAALGQLAKADIAIKMLDLTAPKGKKLLYFLENGDANKNIYYDTSIAYQQTFDFCGRTYRIECYPEKNFIEQNLEKSYIAIPLLSGALTLFIVAYMGALVFQRKKMVELVKVRTKELKESEERFRTLIQNSNDIFTIIDQDGIIHLISPSVTRITGFTPAELMNQSIFYSMYPDDMEDIKKVLGELIANPFQVFINQFRYIKKDGGICYLETVSQNLFEISGVGGIVVNIRDITERKQVEEELRAAKLKAEEMNRVKSSFFANMSHELRTPLHGILGISQILEDQIINPNKKHLVEMLSQSGKRLLNTLNMILNLSRVEANKLDINYTKVNLCQVIKENIRLFEPSAIQKNLKLEYVSDCNDFIIETDEQMLISVLNNMIDNAIKYTNEGCITVISAVEKYEEKAWVVIKVQDTGIGISEADQKIIFDEFRQVSEGYDRSFEGTGLGLSIMKKYIELLNGKITVESKLGVGSTFTVSLPVHDPLFVESFNKQELISQEKQEKPNSENKFKMLLVDDEEITYNIFSIWLNKSVDLDFAENAAEAVERLKRNKYDMVIMDINLKRGGNGIDVLKQMRQIDLHKDTPVIACTAYAMHGDKENLINEGFNFYLSKPFEKEDLMELINIVRQ